MEKFDLSRLSATAFERMVRALCLKYIGPSGVVYSSGPDGARDFTFEGRISAYDSRGWDGYLVLQAKFREKLQGGVADVQWLEKQIESERKKYVDAKANLRKPDFYIVATNISLSGADGNAKKSSVRKGGYSKVVAFLNKWKKVQGSRILIYGRLTR
jgi:hypothetical protein